MEEYREIEAGFEDIQITLRSKVDLYVGKVDVFPSPKGDKVMCVVKSIDKVHVKGGKMTLDCKVEPLYLIDVK